MVLKIERSAFEAIITAARAAHPQEACGILLGGFSHITAMTEAANVHPAPLTHFEIDPQALIDAHRSARSGGPNVIGYYHSHPKGEPRPSQTDAAMAAGDGMIWAIAAGDRVEFWRDGDDGFSALPYSLTR
jgi:proteasome lid subunit RPN8/RPN11